MAVTRGLLLATSAKARRVVRHLYIYICISKNCIRIFFPNKNIVFCALGVGVVADTGAVGIFSGSTIAAVTDAVAVLVDSPMQMIADEICVDSTVLQNTTVTTTASLIVNRFANGDHFANSDCDRLSA